ncbi:hypothetical protein HK101_005703 [Irineochytrium annulatum]|nr:hypothetical protein HK101_005703 [Irineochytrium annulatum]
MVTGGGVNDGEGDGVDEGDGLAVDLGEVKTTGGDAVDGGAGASVAESLGSAAAAEDEPLATTVEKKAVTTRARKRTARGGIMVVCRAAADEVDVEVEARQCDMLKGASGEVGDKRGVKFKLPPGIMLVPFDEDLIRCILGQLDPTTLAGRLALYSSLMSSTSMLRIAAPLLWNSWAGLDLVHGVVIHHDVSEKIIQLPENALRELSLQRMFPNQRPGTMAWRWSMYLRSITRLHIVVGEAQHVASEYGEHLDQIREVFIYCNRSSAELPTADHAGTFAYVLDAMAVA